MLNKYRQRIHDALSHYLEEEYAKLSYQPLGKVVGDKMKALIEGGKFIRGSLVLFAHDMCGGTRSDDALIAACAIELVHSSILIHDDIIDHDTMRRGKPTISSQYEKDGSSTHDPYHYGISQGICAGDIGYFLAFKLLTRMKDSGRGAADLIGSEFAHVGLAQMQELEYEYIREAPTEEEVLDMYRHKTGHYTFSMPLMVGATIAGSSHVSAFDKLGETVGVVFQIRDDELGLFGDEKEMGKPVGSDLEEGKRTVFIVRLLNRATEEEREKIQSILGKQVHEDDLFYLLELFKKYDVRNSLHDMMNSLRQKADAAIDALSVADEHKRALKEFVAYLQERKK